MIEIVLRRDITEFEPKPFFGFTTRQLMTGVAVLAASAATFAALSVAGSVPYSVSMYATFAVGAGVGALGVGRVRGLKPETWLSVTLAERRVPRLLVYARPQISGAPAERPRKKRRLARADRRALKAERREYDPGSLEG